ncbi:hypothetical protein GQ43DRAFT_163142 [Delitschia confertaspora ATCC 74209]|uniref:DUF7492 domain-containing protein n=1 Tax=Delitschia confertaspora ATCC 74209 TaxID=1513339 RepID=A0A9P4JKL4_9PLEO|nr:hypothetical protein GQ43DRAFT_163142 [Delitschia confertaspora ATCC 74209]
MGGRDEPSAATERPHTTSQRLDTSASTTLISILLGKFNTIFSNKLATLVFSQTPANMRSLAFAIMLVVLSQQVLAHSWLEQLRAINEKGEYVGEYGYPRGFADKSKPGFTDSDVYLLPPADISPPFINSSHLLCHPSQRTANQTQDYPRLKVQPGQFMALRYAENGHVSQPDQTLGRPEHGGSVFVFGTAQPIQDEKIADVLQWTKDGRGGDKRGVLLAVNNFDDGRCYELKGDNKIALDRQAKHPNFAQGQVSNGPGNYPLMCETNVAVPKDASSGKPYTLYWVWQWGQAPNMDKNFPAGRDEYYTTCLDVDVVDVLKTDAKPSRSIGQQDATSKAVPEFSSRTAVYSDPIKGEWGTVFSALATSAPSSGSSAPKTSADSTRKSSVDSTPKSSADSAPKTTVITSVASSITATNTGELPLITNHPNPRLGNSSYTPDDDAVTVTVTEHVTVTAPLATKTVEAKRGINKRGSAKFRGLC